MRRLVLLGHVELPVALESLTRGERLPDHVKSVQAEGIRQVKLTDASPIGINIRSTVATYANIHDELRKVFARTPGARESGCKAGDFSYNTGSLRCPVCDGTGSISLDVQFLPDVDIPCPDCHGSRYARKAFDICRKGVSLPGLMAMSVDEALAACADLGLVRDRLQVLHDLGLGYLTLGEATPSLSGGEAQRLKLASEMGRVRLRCWVREGDSPGRESGPGGKLCGSRGPEASSFFALFGRNKCFFVKFVRNRHKRNT